MSWDPHNKSASQRGENVTEAEPEPPRLVEKEEPPEEGESLLLRRTFLRSEKETGEPAQRKFFSELHANQRVSVVRL